MAKNVLIVDDDKELCEELSEILKDEGFSAHYALTHTRARELLESGTYDILLLDFKMPEMSGVDFLQEVKDKLRGIKVFIISGSLIVNKELAERGLSGLVEEVLSKPFSVEGLLDKIK